MFQGLSTRLEKIFKDLRRKAKLTEDDVDAVLRDVRIALLEADVNYLVVKDLITNIKKRAVGSEVSQSLNPAQQVIKIVYDELLLILGDPMQLTLKGEKPRIIMMVGLQGSGKTTAAVKLAKLLQNQGEKVMLVAADVSRPAADLQLIQLANTLNLPVFSDKNLKSLEIVTSSIQKAKNSGVTVLIIDSAGRSQLDDELMAELEKIQTKIYSNETLLVLDAMTGQEAVKIAEGFIKAIPITGLFLTKMDGDARGGAAISIRQVTGVPVKLIGTGETLQDVELFNPKRLADRILGMGDVLGLIERAEEAFDYDQTHAQVEKIKKGKMTLDDYAQQLQQMKKMGSISQILEMLPGNIPTQSISSDEAESKIKKTLAILQSMTIKERKNPDLLNANRRKRIAFGSGTQVMDVNRVIKEFNNFQQLMKKFGKLDKKGISSLFH